MNDEAMLAQVRRQVLPTMEKHGLVVAWIVDDTGFPKQGKHSVGVSSTVANCQAAVRGIARLLMVVAGEQEAFRPSFADFPMLESAHFSSHAAAEVWRTERTPCQANSLTSLYGAGRKKLSQTCLATLRPIWAPWRVECRQCSPAHTRALSISLISAFKSR